MTKISATEKNTVPANEHAANEIISACQEELANMQACISDYVKAHPLKAMGISLLAGFVLAELL